jgi:hypothetical protein
MEPLTRYRRRLDRPVVAVRLDLLAYRIDDVVPSKSLEYLISTRHWLDGTLPDHNVQIARLSANVREFLNRRGQHAPALQRAPISLRKVFTRRWKPSSHDTSDP